jgi:hypothetical protein
MLTSVALPTPHECLKIELYTSPLKRSLETSFLHREVAVRTRTQFVRTIGPCQFEDSYDLLLLGARKQARLLA